MTELPHLIVTAQVKVDGRKTQGVSADGLPPKWFTKNPETTFEQDDLPAMLRVIRHAADTAVAMGPQPSFFRWWHELDMSQAQWAEREQLAELLAGLGVSLIERAVLDALCRHQRVTLFDALRRNLPEIHFEQLDPTLIHVAPHTVLAESPRSAAIVRHTIGLGDSLEETAEQDTDNPNDGLPFTLSENIRAYGLRYFKIKLSGDVDRDQDRLMEIAHIIDRLVGKDARITLDGNENFQNINDFRLAWERLRTVPELCTLFDRALLLVEQPVHRSCALNDEVGLQLAKWDNAPPIIIDESDAGWDSLPRALSLGYRGTSHKNCKGIIKGLWKAAVVARETARHRTCHLTAEDLANVGPVALLQDLAMVAALGIAHVERNGHHYFAGLSMFPESIQNTMLREQGDLYEPHAAGFPTLRIRNGEISLEGINAAPFGVASLPDVGSLEVWKF